MLRSYMKVLAPAAALIGAMTVASSAYAVDTSFATYTGNAGKFTATQTGSAVVLTETETVVFSFLNSSLATSVTGAAATLVFTASAPNTSFVNGTFPDLGDVAGSYKFTSTKAYTINGHLYAAGSDLLTVAFTGADLQGKKNGKTASLSADSTLGSTILYSSDFLIFSNVNTQDFSIALSAINPKFAGAAKLASFTGTPVGVFSSDPAPIVVGSVPEPATWALMLVGFGAIGLGLRTNARRNLRTA